MRRSEGLTSRRECSFCSLLVSLQYGLLSTTSRTEIARDRQLHPRDKTVRAWGPTQRRSVAGPTRSARPLGVSTEEFRDHLEDRRVQLDLKRQSTLFEALLHFTIRQRIALISFQGSRLILINYNERARTELSGYLRCNMMPFFVQARYLKKKRRKTPMRSRSVRLFSLCGRVPG